MQGNNLMDIILLEMKVNKFSRAQIKLKSLILA